MREHDWRFLVLEARIAALQRGPIPSAPPASRSTSTSQREAWEPGLVEVRGWALLACGPDERYARERREYSASAPCHSQGQASQRLLPLQP